MSAESGDWKWTYTKERAAALVAEDGLTDKQIAHKLKVAERTLERWKLAPEFTARVAELVDAFRAAVREHGIGIVENRVAALEDRWRRMRQVIQERADDESTDHVPGGKTGLLVRQTKFVKVYEAQPREGPPKRPSSEWTDEDPDVPEGEPDHDIYPSKRVIQVEEFVIDTGLLSELRAHELQAAKELGQLTERKDITSGGKVISGLGISDLTDEEIDRRIAAAQRGKAAPDLPSEP